MNEKNNVAFAIRVIAIIEFVCAVVLCFVAIGTRSLLFFWIALAGVISGLMFLGFAEIIDLLHKSLYTQAEILKEIQNSPPTEGTGPRHSVVEDIESELPEI